MVWTWVDRAMYTARIGQQWSTRIGRTIVNKGISLDYQSPQRDGHSRATKKRTLAVTT